MQAERRLSAVDFFYKESTVVNPNAIKEMLEERKNQPRTEPIDGAIIITEKPKGPPWFSLSDVPKGGKGWVGSIAYDMTEKKLFESKENTTHRPQPLKGSQPTNQ